MREFFFKNPLIKAFIKGLDRKDERVLFNSLKSTDFDAGERLIRKNTKDRAIIIVGTGQFVAFKETANEIYGEGAILGVTEFLNDSPWKDDIICSKGGYICKLYYDTLSDLVSTAPMCAVKILRRIIRHQCYTFICDKKTQQQKNFDFFKV